jgi:Holliday junction resolvase RusA-like endonuclease
MPNALSTEIISFCLYLKPTSLQGHNRIGGAGENTWFYASPKKKAWQRAVTAAAAQFKPEKPFQEAVGLAIAFTFSRTTSSLSYPVRRMDGDFDNLSKSFVDCLMKAGFLTDDKFIVDAWISKRFGDQDKVEVIIGPKDLWCTSLGIPK